MVYGICMPATQVAAPEIQSQTPKILPGYPGNHKGCPYDISEKHASCKGVLMGTLLYHPPTPPMIDCHKIQDLGSDSKNSKISRMTKSR